ncbi:tellurite resistance TerB C-terminal domain-containing protein [Leadbettera azotonutricia]|uniref:TerB-C domain-containing protein n=1 Tax=Leadbettera azotonutricia (strain ATCC BAA-888 / DSM 13862 / ZAS-9) TaxID=545695 RepID=F5YG52_LEAAZ|nr:tellurite resistance TerB C-terminal domain-containing protein [Leadbettera azotonutricia]AEF82680.1 hypothetical protein TREAZ_0026 [Leadbettera azotonutricia ZAS-9]
MAGFASLLSEPFFSIQYDPEKACFARNIPRNAEDLGGGKFRRDGESFRLPEDHAGEYQIFESKIINARDAAALARRGYNPLIKTGPSMAERGDRLMELGINGGLPALGKKMRPGARVDIRKLPQEAELCIIWQEKIPQAKWLPLEGLPNYRFYDNKIYEVIPDDALSRLFPLRPDGSRSALVLKDEEIPAFADDYAKLIYVFAEEKLYSFLSQNNLFVDGAKISLILRCAPVMENGVGRAMASPALKYGKKLYSPQVLSKKFRQRYMALDNQWVRREALESIGIGPLGRYISGEALSPFKVKPKEIIQRGSEKTQGLWQGFEWDKDRWVRYGSENEIFCSHLEFLRVWGIQGGIVSGGREKTASYTAEWLRSIEGETSKQRVLLIVPKSFWDHWLKKELPRLFFERHDSAAAVWDPAFRGIGVAFYSEISKHKNTVPWDIIVPIGMEEALAGETGFRDDLYQAICQIPARLRLGVFFSPAEIYKVNNSKTLKAFFGIRGNLTEFEKYLIRECGDFLSVPQGFEYGGINILRPPSPWGKDQKLPDNCFVIGSGRFIIESRFQNIPYHFVSEASDKKLRDIILCMGGRKPEEAMAELGQFLIKAQSKQKELKKYLPQWLLDFAVIYKCPLADLKDFLGFENTPPILRDLYLHKKYIEENNILKFKDFSFLIPQKILVGAFRRSDDGHLLDEAIESAVNTADRMLRSNYGKKLLEFFYPLPARKESFRAFEKIDGMGKNVYTAEWISFSHHKPLKAFLGALSVWIEHRLRKEKDFGPSENTPMLDPLWGYLSGLGQEPKAEDSIVRIELESEKIKRLREESNAVMELLKVENPLDYSEYRMENFETLSSAILLGDETEAGVKNNFSMPAFIETLGEADKACLELISAGASQKDIEELALGWGTMAEVIIDGINEHFIEEKGDLLIENTLDEKPLIQAEYRDEVLWALTFQKD